MSGKRKQAKSPELRVVFDTNAIFTESAAFLVKLEVSEIIRGNSSHPDLRIRWYLPEVVRWEREFQMRENGFALLSSVGKIEKVLKHNLNITEQTIIERVPLLVEEQLQELGVEIISFDPARIDWPRLVRDSASRKAPFEKGEKEKGFRDAVILESFLQLVERSPKTASSCLIALVARDARLTAAAKERTEAAKNIRFVEDISALKGLINTLVARVDEEFIENIKEEAAIYFFKRDKKNPDEKSGLMYREKVLQQIQARFGKQLTFVPAGYDGKDLARVLVNNARFSRKEGRRVYWVTRIEYEYKPYRLKSSEDLGGYLSSLGPQIASTQGSTEAAGSLKLSDYLPVLGQTLEGIQSPIGEASASTVVNPWRPMEKNFGSNVRIFFDVTWSVIISIHRRKFSSPRIESIDHVPSA